MPKISQDYFTKGLNKTTKDIVCHKRSTSTCTFPQYSVLIVYNGKVKVLEQTCGKMSIVHNNIIIKYLSCEYLVTVMLLYLWFAVLL